MSRRKKDPPGTVSADWRSYRPQDPLYRKYGGPFVPVEKIDPEPFPADRLFSYAKKLDTRLKWVEEEQARCEQEPAGHTAYYLALHEKGIDALKHAWLREADRNQDASDVRDSVPRNVNRHRASSYQQIHFFSGKVAACRTLLAELDSISAPLFRWRG